MITVTRPLKYDVVETFKIENAELSKDNSKLIIVGTDANDKPIRVVTYVGNEVAEDIVFGGILAQLECYQTFPNAKACVEAIRDHKGSELKVKLIHEEYEDPMTLTTKIGTKTLFNPADF